MSGGSGQLPGNGMETRDLGREQTEDMAGLAHPEGQPVKVADYAIAGDVVRVVLSGAPDISVSTAKDLLDTLRREHEDFRRFAMEEPRGHAGIVDMSLLYPPVGENAVRTLVVGTQAGYVPLAGTPLLSSAAALLETGQVPVTSGETEVIFDTGAGEARVVARMHDGRCERVRWDTFRPSVIEKDRSFSYGDRGAVSASIISTGLPFLVADGDQCGASFLDSESLGHAGSLLSSVGKKQLPLKEIGLEHAFSDYIVMLTFGGINEMQNGDVEIRAACIMPDGSVSRMPSGLGTLSVAASLHASGHLASDKMLTVRTPAGFELGAKITDTSAELHGKPQLVAMTTLVASRSP